MAKKIRDKELPLWGFSWLAYKLIPGLSLLFVVTLTPTASALEIAPGARCEVYKQKITYQNKVYTCIKSGKKLVWNKGKVVKLTPPLPLPNVKPEVFDIEGNLYLKMDAIVTQWAPYLSALENNKVTVISEDPGHPREIEVRLSAEVSFEILRQISPKMVSPTYYLYETTGWTDKQIATTCPFLVGHADTSAGAEAGCGNLVISNLNGWSNKIAGIDGSWFESAHEIFHIAQFGAGLDGTDPNISVAYKSIPSWYREGSASTFAGLVRSLMSKGKYNFGDFNSFEKSPLSYNECSKAWSFWQQSNDATGFEATGQCEYGLGRRMTDYLVAWHGGVESILNNYQYIAQGKSFPEAFKLSHGIELVDFFVEVKPFLAKQGFVIP